MPHWTLTQLKSLDHSIQNFGAGYAAGMSGKAIRAFAIEALRVMWDGGFRHLPVTESGNVVGLVQRRAFKSEDLHLLEDERELWEHMR